MWTAMRELLRGRFARRLALAFAALGIGTAVLTAVLVNTAFTDRFENYLSEQQRTSQQQLVALFAADYARDGAWNAQALNELAPTVTMTGSEAELLDPAGRKVWSLADADVTAATLAMHREMMGTGDLGAPRSLPITVDGQRVATLQVRVPQGVVPAVDRDFQASVNRLLAAGALGAALVALVVGVYTARRATAPIAELTRAADDLAAGQRDRRAATVPSNEIGQLATAFNTMADRVEREDELRRAFAADVAHELRTPLAILRSELEAVQDGVRDATPKVIDSLHDETLRLGRLIADLETLASADAAAFTLERTSLSLIALVRDATASLAGRFTEAGLTLRTDLDDVRVDGDEVRLRQIVTNQLTNALKFVPGGGTVTVTLRQEDGWAELRVADTGPGIPAEDLPRVFDRFFRSRDARADGSGIGLAVAAELAAAHGGTLTADSEVGRGTTFTTRLPALGRRPKATGGRGPQRAAAHDGGG
ncbi:MULTISPECIES: ATP-binding protein [Streptomyces]|uniref:histidine kinase n=1 Tax=Streptomyces zinciresistens K42 TaxID=700597 RepID=G2G5T4_9ACTN|nr:MULTISPECIES: ATP-binding protein [Streptomyces]EGX61023.1 putative sensory transduction histidine kinase [Streptomyces zinciresistens K42]MDT9696550.1 ATP-binding protein [Streptomyces sp. P17]